MFHEVDTNKVQIEDLKMYFDDSEEQKEGASPTDELDGPEMLLSPRTIPSNRDALIAQLPERHIADRLIMRYFSSMSASQRKHTPNLSFSKNHSLTQIRYCSSTNLYKNGMLTYQTPTNLPMYRDI